MSSLLSKILPHIKGNNIPIYTSLNVGDNQIYRGDPKYKESVWQDWANCDWGEEGIIPVHILIFVDLMDLNSPNLVIDKVNIPGPDQYAIVHMIKYPLESVVHKKKHISILKRIQDQFFSTQLQK